MTRPDCLFCQYADPEKNAVISETELAYARWDNFPAAPGHAEIVPKRHVESYFELAEAELLSLHGLAMATREIIDRRYSPDAYTIGVNDGAAAGQTIPHVHLHLITRYEGDVANPRGGIRNVIPGMGDY